MKKAQIIDSLISDAGGGTRSASDMLTPKYVAKNLDAARAEAIEKRWLKFNVINPLCYQKFYMTLDSNLQVQPNTTLNNFPYNIFRLPSVIQLGENDGIRYLGALNCIDNWRRIRSREEMSVVLKHPYTKISNHPDDIYYLYDGNKGQVQVYNTNIQEGLCEGIFQNPTEIPTFNVDYDDYPIDIEMVDLIRNILFQRFMMTKEMPKESLPYEQPNAAAYRPVRTERRLPPTE
ncbi:MAG: hypothetical protein ACYDHY_19610 [Acidiferrobacterales bacterium]